jgi:hypothetical protein
MHCKQIATLRTAEITCHGIKTGCACGQHLVCLWHDMVMELPRYRCLLLVATVSMNIAIWSVSIFQDPPRSKRP